MNCAISSISSVFLKLKKYLSAPVSILRNPLCWIDSSTVKFKTVSLFSIALLRQSDNWGFPKYTPSVAEFIAGDSLHTSKQ